MNIWFIECQYSGRCCVIFYFIFCNLYKGKKITKSLKKNHRNLKKKKKIMELKLNYV